MMNVLGWIGLGFLALILIGVVGMFVGARTAESPVPLGVRNGQLAPCPPTPNCVSSQASDAEHLVAALPYDGNTVQARATLRTILATYQNVTILRDEADYLHALFRSPTFGFPDDVEFYFAAATNQIHVRSASRMGRGDLGVNRARVESIRSAWEQATR